MKIEVIVVSPFQQNCRILICEETGEAVIVDPGDDAEVIAGRIEALKVTPKYLLATHGHIDHIGAAADLQERLSLPFHLHKGDMGLVKNLPAQMSMLLGRTDCKVPRVDHFLEADGNVSFGRCSGKVLHTPGHSPGSVSFLFGNDLLCGDLVFAGSIGRTDLPGGSLATLQCSLREKILTLPANTRIHSGHGPSTTIADENESLQYWLSLPA